MPPVVGIVPGHPIAASRPGKCRKGQAAFERVELRTKIGPPSLRSRLDAECGSNSDAKGKIRVGHTREVLSLEPSGESRLRSSSRRARIQLGPFMCSVRDCMHNSMV